MGQLVRRTRTTVIVPIQNHNGTLRIICSNHVDHEQIASHREFGLLSQQENIDNVSKFVSDHVGVKPESIKGPVQDNDSNVTLYIARIPDNHCVHSPLTRQTLFQVEQVLDFCKNPTRVNSVIHTALGIIKKQR